MHVEQPPDGRMEERIRAFFLTNPDQEEVEGLVLEPRAQAKIGIWSGAVEGAEFLVSVRDVENNNIIRGLHVIGALEKKKDRIVDWSRHMTWRMLRAGAQYAPQIAARHKHSAVSTVNVFPWQLKEGLAADTRSVLRASGTPAHMLGFELLEHERLLDSDALAELAAMGLHLAIDDVGCNALGGIEELREDRVRKLLLPGVRELKIDLALRDHPALVEALVELRGRFGDIELTVEGVRTETALKALQDRLANTGAAPVRHQGYVGGNYIKTMRELLHTHTTVGA